MTQQSNTKRKIFWVILLSLPILILSGGELLLRELQYGGNFDLVVMKEINSKTYYALNRDVARRYFSQKGITVPEAHDDAFEYRKQPTTKRIFMLGESTMAGFPYDYNATAPPLLRNRLQRIFPQYNVEVINAGISAINSYTVRDFMNELVNYEPDAFIIYLGHNEFYGAMGIGSTEYLGQSAWLVNLYLRMNDIRLFRLMRDGVSILKNLFSSDVTPQNATLMEAMVGSKTITYNSREYNIAKKNFEINLRSIIATAKDRKIPLVISTLVSNLRDQQPLLACFSETTSDQIKLQWNALFDSGKTAQRNGNVRQALGYFQRSIDLDSLNAAAHFHIAQCLDIIGRYGDALNAYRRARDYDGMRFRASSDFNQLLHNLCTEHHIVLADAEQMFTQHSPHGLVGSNLMLEHLHPNFDGYSLLAKAFFQAIVDHSLLGEEYRWERNLSDDEYKNLSGVTEFDLEVGKYRIFELTNSWPFKQANEPQNNFVAQNYIQELAVTYVRKGITWSDAHYNLAERFKQQGNYERARREFLAVANAAPYSYYPIMQIGDMYRLMDKTAEAESTYLLALTKQETPYVHVRLGMLYFEQNKTQQAIEQFEVTIAREVQNNETMDTKSRSMARYLLGAAYGKNGELDKAKIQLTSAVQIDPSNTQAKSMLAQIP